MALELLLLACEQRDKGLANIAEADDAEIAGSDGDLSEGELGYSLF